MYFYLAVDEQPCCLAR